MAPARGDQTRVRLGHLEELSALPQRPYVSGSVDTIEVGDLAAGLWEQEPAPALTVTGRVRAVRDHGGVVFVRLVQGQRQVQLVLERDALGRQRLLDIQVQHECRVPEPG